MWMRSAIEAKRIARSLAGRDSPHSPDKNQRDRTVYGGARPQLQHGALAGKPSSSPCPSPGDAARPLPAGPSAGRSRIGIAGIDQVFQRGLDDAGVVIQLDRNRLLQDVLSDDLAV